MADKIRVLIVDDITETRDHLARLLGFESDMEIAGLAESGRRAIELAIALKPDIVLMDINMPDMDGIEATEQLSAQVPGASVVMMSVQGEADYLRRSMLAGAREFLVKPFSSDELTSSIRQIYAREREKLERFPIAVAARGRRAPRSTPARSSRSSARRAASAGPRSPSTWPLPQPPSSASGPPSSTARSSSATSASCSTSIPRTSRSPISRPTSRPASSSSRSTHS